MPRKQHPVEVYGLDTIIDDGLDSKDITAIQLLQGILTTLKKIEFHLSIASDTTLNDQDV